MTTAMQTTSTSKRMTVSELEEKKRLVRRIKAGLATYIQVGQDLTRLRDGRLYRDTHENFEDFVEEVFTMSRPHAYRFIEAAQVVSESETGGYAAPKNLEQASALAGVPMALRPQVMEELNENPRESSGARLEELAKKAFMALPPKEQAEMVEENQKRVERLVSKTRNKDAVEQFEMLIRKQRKLLPDLHNGDAVKDALDHLYDVLNDLC